MEANLEAAAPIDKHNCLVVGCRNTQDDKNICFFPFPSEMERQSVWLRVIGRSDLIDVVDARDRDYRVCSKHFTKSAKTEVIVRKLVPDALPTKYLPTSRKMSIMEYERDEGCSDVATQTILTYGFNRTVIDKEVYVEMDGKMVKIKTEKDPEIPSINTFVLPKAIKREPVAEQESTSKKNKN